MTRPRYRLVLPVVVFLLLMRAGESCGPAFAGLVFTRPHGPDGPMSAFTGGRIGVPLPKWQRAYLVVAYRHLEGKPLSQSEAASFARLWDTEKGYGPPPDPVNTAVEKWLKFRGRYAAALPDSLEAYRGNGYSSHLNCSASAFLTAMDTLGARARRFGAESKELQQWLAGQDAVFRNCQGGTFFPPELPAHADQLLQADHAYQVAAVHFYSGNFPQARADFDTISRDTESPWHSIAPYLAARAVLRQSSGGIDLDQANDTALLHEAERRLRAVIQDPGRKQWHHDARKLINLIAFRLEPLQYQHRLAGEIARGGTGEDFGQNVRDYTLLLDKFLDEEPDFPGIARYDDKYDVRLEQWRREQYRARRQERQDDLTDWIMTFQSDSKAARQHAISKWRATRAVPWLFLALAKLDGAAPESAEAIKAATETENVTPVMVALRYQCARLLRERGDREGARQMLEKIQETQQALSLSTMNLLRNEQMNLSYDLEGFASQLAWQPVRLSYEWYDDVNNGCYSAACNLTFFGSKTPARNSPLLQQFDPTVAGILNTRIPTETLVQIVNRKSLPEHLQRRLAVAVWARAALLDQPDLASQVGESAIAARPELKRFVEELTAAADKDERRFVAAFAIAHFPGLRPFVDSIFPRETDFAQADNYRDNWWCADVGGDTAHANYEKQWRLDTDPGRSPLPAPAFLTADQIRQADAEWKTLFRLGTSDEYLPRILIAWAKRHPDDPRTPEALHFSSRVSRYACSPSDSPDNHFSYEAFKILHKKYPRSEWTKKTKYWF